MEWIGKYSVLRDGRLMWTEGYEFGDDKDGLFTLFREDADFREWFVIAAQAGIRIGES